MNEPEPLRPTLDDVNRVTEKARGYADIGQPEVGAALQRGQANTLLVQIRDLLAERLPAKDDTR